MTAAVEWDAAGTPRSTRFDDVHHCAAAGLARARGLFLQGCGLPAAWSGQRQWKILETGFGLGSNFLAAWRCWKDDPQRPGLLHFVSIEAWPADAGDLLRAAAGHPDLQDLAGELAAQWYGLTPGFHRLAFEGGRVMLTLCVGDVRDMLREQAFRADSVFLDGFAPSRNPAMWELPVLKAVARLCRRGATIATSAGDGAVRRDLAQCGFRLDSTEDTSPEHEGSRGVYDPAWEPKGASAPDAARPGRVAVIGAGLAGAAVAAALARRGWEVAVFDQGAEPAAGASGLPAGLMAPHQTPDDNVLSRLTRQGVRATLQQAERLLERGREWQPTGVLESRADDHRPPPSHDAGQAWTRVAEAGQLRAAGLHSEVHGWWHEKAAWVKPASLVKAWLGIAEAQWHGGVAVDRCVPAADGTWTLCDHQGRTLGEADLVVVAAALGSKTLLEGRVWLNPVRGQVSWGYGVPDRAPPFPVNGHGHFIPCAPLADGNAWLSGATYGRGDGDTSVREEDHRANLERIRELMPAVATELEDRFSAGEVRAWTGVRCASRDRRPLVGLLAPGLATCTALGSRGLTFSTLCAELLAARLHAEPLPLEHTLAEMLDVRRQLADATPAPAAPAA